MIQGPQLIILLAIVLLLFGGSKLPKLARSLGESQREFREGLKDAEANAPAANASVDGANTAAPATNTAPASSTDQTPPPGNSDTDSDSKPQT